jgi:hypothetical protein
MGRLKSRLPSSVRSFQLFFVSSWVLSVVNVLVHYERLRTFAINSGHAPAGPVASSILAIIMGSVIWFAIVRKASNIFKWLFIVLTVWDLVGTVQVSHEFERGGKAYAAIWLLSVAIQTMSAVMLFRRDAVEWLKSGGKVRPVESSDFD